MQPRRRCSELPSQVGHAAVPPPPPPLPPHVQRDPDWAVDVTFGTPLLLPAAMDDGGGGRQGREQHAGASVAPAWYALSVLAVELGAMFISRVVREQWSQNMQVCLLLGRRLDLFALSFGVMN